jgi:hypothetical protein
MKAKLIFTLSFLLSWSVLGSDTAPQQSGSIEPVLLPTIELGGFWQQQVKRLTVKWLPHCIRQMEKGGEGEELLNLVATGKTLRGEPQESKYTGAPWSDAYIYNTVEAICFGLAFKPRNDAELAKAQADTARETRENGFPSFSLRNRPTATSTPSTPLPNGPAMPTRASMSSMLWDTFWRWASPITG